MGARKFVKQSVCDDQLCVNRWQYILVFECECKSDEFAVRSIGVFLKREVIQSSKRVPNDGGCAGVDSGANKCSGRAVCSFITMIAHLLISRIFMIFT
jgi:hypothetical protein